MRAGKLVAGISCVWILASGCSMCQHPSYDCGPVWTQNGCANCDPDYRAGSVLNRRAQGDMAVEAAPDAKERPHRLSNPCRLPRNRRGSRPSRLMDWSLRAARRPRPNQGEKWSCVHPSKTKPGTRRRRMRSCPMRPCRTICRRARLPRRREPRKALLASSRSPITASMSCSETLSPWRLRTRRRSRPQRRRAQHLGGWRPVAAQQAPADR